MNDTEKLLIDAVKLELDSYKKDIEKRLEDKQNLSNESIKSLNESLQKIDKALVEHSEMIHSMKESKATPAKIDLKKCIKDAVEKLKQQGSGRVEIVKSFPTTMLESTHLSGQIPQAEREPGYNNLLRQAFVVRQLANSFGITSNYAEWVEQYALSGAAGMQVEGQPKAIVDWMYRVAGTQVETIADYVKISEQMLNDVEMIQNEINSNLTYQIDLKKNQQLLFGTGTSPQIHGLTTYAQTVDNANLANTIVDANYLDAIGAAIAQIYNNGKGKFIPNAVLMNPIDEFVMKYGSKDADGTYLLPTFFMPNGEQINGVRIVPDVTIPAGHFLAGDFRWFTIRDKEGLTITIGRENDDFTRNLVTIRAEERLCSYVKANDVEAFIYDEFATVISYINKAS